MTTRKEFTGDELVQLFLIKERLFEISMFCKKQGWHKAGLHLCVGSDELDKITTNLLVKHLKRGLEEHEQSRRA